MVTVAVAVAVAVTTTIRTLKELLLVVEAVVVLVTQLAQEVQEEKVEIEEEQVETEVYSSQEMVVVRVIMETKQKVVGVVMVVTLREQQMTRMNPKMVKQGLVVKDLVVQVVKEVVMVKE